MPSIIEGYTYDIFISYRQKDNKYDGWVTEFVDNLRKELEATFKEDISVYFDINPHDGLLETHDVDASLKEKLKCLIFIPVISRTYCDPKSFAWENEFKAFITMASKDQFGLKVKLPSGNVANRVLPVHIHDLDPEDRKMCGAVLGGFMRGIEFIYKEPGVDRPLTSKDNEEKNLNKTSYRNQINKVALAIKELVSAVKHQEHKPEPAPAEAYDSSPKRGKNNLVKILTGIFLGLLLIIFGILFIPKLIGSKEQPEKSIAVLPFKNLSNDQEQEYFSDGMVEAIIDNLYKVGGMKVVSSTSSIRYKGSKLPLKTIAHELGVSALLEGSVQKIGNKVRITSQLIDTKSDSHLWSETFDRDLSDIFSIYSEVAQNVARELKVKLLASEQKLLQPVSLTKNQDAYDYYLKGTAHQEKGELTQAIEQYSKAIKEDPNFVAAYAKRSKAHSFCFLNRNITGWQNHEKLALEDLTNASEINPNLPEVKIAQLYYHYQVKRDYEIALNIINGLKTNLPNYADLYSLSGYIYRRKGQFEESINEQKTGLQLDPFSLGRINGLIGTYTLSDQFDNAISFARQGLSVFPDIQYLKSAIYLATLYKTSDLKTAIKESAVSEDDVKWDVLYLGRQFDKCLEYALKDSISVNDQFSYVSTKHIAAFLFYLSGNKSLSRAYADSAIIDVKEKIKEFPYDDRYYASLAFIYFYLGEYNEAIACGKKAVELKPVKLDALQGTREEINLMNVYFLTGNLDLALDKMEYLLSIPCDLYVGKIKIDPLYDKFRDMPRFKKIINSAHKKLNVN